ncbi:hypothetical protein GCM10023191_043190 [Actinoallomurus oryzae]|jgi:hypothetical protein|uniref:Uncharacterized protein n=1 Tax=Actinoallomurus oryzae TaxID=502180 RepID=A0ABP8Q6H3_9ACTN
MSFHVKFLPSSAPDGAGVLDEDEPIDDPMTFAIEVCPVLEDLGVGFVAGGFGEERWPVDVATDLATIVPQLRDLIAALGAGAPGMLEFFEQGIERRVSFTPQGDTVELHCESWGGWRPPTPVEHADLGATRAMLTDLAVGFSREVARLLPALAGSPYLPA